MANVHILTGFRKRVFWQMERVGAKFAEEMGNGHGMLEIWNERAQNKLVKLA